MIPRWRFGAVGLAVVLAALSPWPWLLVSAPVAGIYAWAILSVPEPPRD